MSSRWPSLSIVTRLAAGAALSGALLLVGAPASAHSELEQTTPEAGSTVEAAPTQVELVFGEDVQAAGSGIVVKGPDGSRYDQPSTFAVNGTTASVQLKTSGQAGTYTVTFRVVSTDGHVVSDSFEYTVADSAAVPVPVTESTGPAAPQDDNAVSAVWVLGLGAIGIVLVAAVIAVAVRGRRGRRA